MVFRYVKNGKALANVLHQEELGADFSGAYDPYIGDQLDVGEHYRVWMFDLQNEAAQPVTGMPNTSWGFHASDLDDRSFVFLPYEDFGRTRVFEIDMNTGVATQRFDTTAWVYDWVRVRSALALSEYPPSGTKLAGSRASYLHFGRAWASR